MLRRQSPVGVTSGLYQGLTGLGLSVLGAVAGVADQPLQGIFALAGGEDNLSNMQILSQVRLFFLVSIVLSDRMAFCVTQTYCRTEL